MKIALVHDYLREYGGAERVLEVIHEIFPDAPLYTAYYNPQGLGKNAKNFKGWDIRTSWMQKIPFANRLISPFRIFAPLMFESFDFKDYDLVISSSSAVYFAKSVLTKPETLHISYIHTPPRFLYGYTTSFNYKKHFLTKILGEISNHFLRIYDFIVSQRPDILLANSKNVQARIKKFYRRDSVVIYPPVDTDKFKSQISKLKTTSQNSKSYYLSVGRLVRGKGIDIIIKACGKLDLPLKVVGSGPELANFQFSISNFQFKNIKFLGAVSDEELPALYAGARATIVASEDEDFGIVPVESMACGTPVIAPRAGGFLETVVEGKTGMFFGEDRGQPACRQGRVTVDSLVKVLQNFNNSNYLSGQKVAEVCQKQAEKFGKERFKKEILDLVEENIKSDIMPKYER